VEFLPRVELRAEDRVALAAQVAEVLEKLHRLREATTYWAIAAALAPASPSRAGFQDRLHKVKTEIKVQRQDALRRPVVTEHLEQKGTVRPRLTAKSGEGEVAARGGGRR